VSAAAVTPDRHTAGAELALVAVAAVWGLTFVMVQDAIALLPTMAFLGYRFASAGAMLPWSFVAAFAPWAGRAGARACSWASF
jgi:hypothetical protein